MAKYPCILVAEDARDILTRLLQHNGYHVITAANGQEALASFQNEQPDIILLDLSMPVLDGWKTCQLKWCFTPDAFGNRKAAKTGIL